MPAPWMMGGSTATVEFEPPKAPVGEVPITIHWGGRTIFEMRKDGKITADWATLMRLKDKLLANDCADSAEVTVCSWAAALWFARNT